MVLEMLALAAMVSGCVGATCALAAVAVGWEDARSGVAVAIQAMGIVLGLLLLILAAG